MGGWFSSDKGKEVARKCDSTMACSGEGWIINTPSPPQGTSLPPAVSKALKKITRLVRQKCLSETHVWWFLRWTYFDSNGTPKDAEARFRFLEKYLGTPTLQGFLSHEEAITVAKKKQRLRSDLFGRHNSWQY